jgi:hypothetical protein
MADGDSVYLGDGVYLDYLDGDELCIYLNNGVKKTSHIYMDEAVQRTLLKVLIDCSEGEHGKA